MGIYLRLNFLYCNRNLAMVYSLLHNSLSLRFSYVSRRYEGRKKDIYRWLAARNLPISDSCLSTAPLPINRNFDASV